MCVYTHIDTMGHHFEILFVFYPVQIRKSSHFSFFSRFGRCSVPFLHFSWFHSIEIVAKTMPGILNHHLMWLKQRHLHHPPLITDFHRCYKPSPKGWLIIVLATLQCESPFFVGETNVKKCRANHGMLPPVVGEWVYPLVNVNSLLWEIT